MAVTYFNQDSVWMHLKNDDEIKYLQQLLAKSKFEFVIQSIEETDDLRLGRRLTVKIRRPNNELNSRYLYGKPYTEWEKIKSKVYAFRRNY